MAPSVVATGINVRLTCLKTVLHRVDHTLQQITLSDAIVLWRAHVVWGRSRVAICISLSLLVLTPSELSRHYLWSKIFICHSTTSVVSCERRHLVRSIDSGAALAVSRPYDYRRSLYVVILSYECMGNVARGVQDGVGISSIFSDL